MIDKLAWIALQDKKVLTARSKNKTKFYIPGGKRESGETDAMALIREIAEELSVTLEETSLKYYGAFRDQADGHPSGTYVQMTCYTAHYQGEIQPSAEIEEIKWLQNKDRDQISFVDQLIFDDLFEKKLIE